MLDTLDARKNRLDASQAWDIVGRCSVLSVAKGKKIVEISEVADNQDEVLKKIMGPSGNLRAPTLKVGNKYVVGFNLELYESIFG